MKDRILQLRKVIDHVLLVLSFLCSLGILFHIGYNTDVEIEHLTNRILELCFFFFAFALLIKTLTQFVSQSSKITIYAEAILCIYFIAVTIADNYYFSGADGTQLVRPEWMYVGIYGIFMIELSKKTLFFDQFYFNPTLLFVLSFLLLILLGTALLLLPKSTYDRHITFVDALFLATSAVCVTGLSVVDVASEFTRFGQSVLLILIQIGGLGIMTFTGFFGYFFSGGFSFKNQLMFTELIGEGKIGSVIKTLYKIILVTLSFEILGASLIFLTLDEVQFDSVADQIYFSVFHAISAFCNAGFSSVSGGINHIDFRFNYNFHLILIALYVLGGLGFAIVFNVYEFVKRWLWNLFHKVVYRRAFIYRAQIIAFNSKIIAYTTFILILVGFLLVFVLEYQNTLAEHPTIWGKMVSALFTATTPRTAGFNAVDMGHLSFPTIMLIFLLMWIGAAPGSTGGGVKVTTIALASMNIYSLVKGKESIEMFGRRVTGDSSSRAFAIISLSLIFLGMSIFALSLTDSDKHLISLAFESFSAYSTSGLSLGVTDKLSNAGKLVITITMFVGRVGFLTLLIAIIKKDKPKNYRFPNEQMNF
ncbi:Trk-type K+ transport system membrane component [Dyadobacter jejuensis]|uniref:Trk-type K+ transport system membrane component n=1 Tax=Dyadobacter jejuensis TaxID=1082580 RepID=A0A316AG61_9BACT|nr:potassium transporter TrkG [Dyadobacter jejuensis]PWJ56693.1 Trk-type K+ transport system membrane component [Dyadobacter jejuensis]